MKKYFEFEFIRLIIKLEFRRIKNGAVQKEFIEFMVDCGVLKFGDFVTKSGRKTPFL